MIKAAICEDSRLDCKMLKEIVCFLMTDRGLDFQVDTYENAETLVEGYSNHPYDLIFLDIMMDEIDGIEAGRRIRAVDTKSEIVYCTSSKDFAIAAYEIHAMGYLLKPYESGRIGAMIDYYIQKHPQKNQNFIFFHGLANLKCYHYFHVPSVSPLFQEGPVPVSPSPGRGSGSVAAFKTIGNHFS